MTINLVTAEGRFVTASEKSHPDLYWALRGGGVGTYGVVTSIVIRVHPKKYYELYVPFANVGTYSFCFIFNCNETINGDLGFDMRSFFVPNHTISSFDALSKPWFDAVKALGIIWTSTSNTMFFESYYPAYMSNWGMRNFPVGTVQTMAGNRLLPRSHFLDPPKLNATLEVLKQHAH
ncbi:hypothetical protein CC78DRAFT_584918 [Lojkania enalia]|uniref:FAD-binding PCMH-type domain-containing protein n=1 Tax=Lojkania enalia TaxID=147567 RepID=A0A9P4K300_9PLEO|nr:hypothetical protein CC78DRAFT_584918 [Didymosphaeria enalia]